MPLIPGADLFDIFDRASEISERVILGSSHVGRGVGSCGCSMLTSCCVVTKNRRRNALDISAGSSET